MLLIHYFNSTESFVHDAAVTWVESVTNLNFKLCALKAGRTERLTPDDGLTFVDYVAIQESPAGAIAGNLEMPRKWWEGTSCKTLSFQQVRKTDADVEINQHAIFTKTLGTSFFPPSANFYCRSIACRCFLIIVAVKGREISAP